MRLSLCLPRFCAALFVLAVTAGAFNGGMWASLGIGGALAMFLAVWRIDGRAPLPRGDLAALAFAMLWVGALASFHSLMPEASWHLELRLATIVLPLILFSSARIAARATAPVPFAALPWLMMLGALALGIELMLDGPLLHALRGAQPLTWYNRGISYVAVLALPVMAQVWLSKRRWMIVPFAVALLFPLHLTDSRAAKMAFLLALLTTAFAAWRPILARRLCAAGAVLAAALPLAVQDIFFLRPDLGASLPASWRHRIEIWDYMSYRIGEHPWLGWGLGTSRYLSCTSPVGANYLDIPPCAPHPHNVLIQLWVETGVPGLIAGLLFALWMLREAGRLDRRLAPFSTGAWVAAFSISLVAYDLWTDSLFAAFALTAFAFALLERQIAGGKV